MEIQTLNDMMINGEIDTKTALNLLDRVDDKKSAALAKWWYDNEKEICFDVEEEGESVYIIEGREYLVYTDEEANEVVAEYIMETLWAFNPYFLSAHTNLPGEVFESLQEKCESGNDAILRIVKGCGDIDYFIDDAISVDGRGHFLSGYDGEENEVEFDGVYYFIYRVN